MRVVITGTSSGIGRATALKFIMAGHEVFGVDIKDSTIEGWDNYSHIKADIAIQSQLPVISDVNILINNAGTIDENLAIKVNLEGYINVTEKYAFQNCIKSVIFVGSISGVAGIDGPRYSASQGGRIAYMKNVAMALGNKYKATVNCLSPGAVITGLEPDLYARQDLVEAVANENILKKWITAEEIADWIYFLAIVNKSMTSQNILVDNGESSNYNFISSK